MSSIVRHMLIGAVLLSAARGQDFQGAEAVLQSLEEATQAKGQAPPSRKAADLREKIQSLRAAAPTLPPTEAANRWLTVLNRYLSLTYTDLTRESNPSTTPSDVVVIPTRSGSRLNLTDVLSALPPSAVWDEIGTRLARRNPPDALPELLVSVLRGDNTAQSRALGALRQKAADSDSGVGGEHFSERKEIQQFQDALELLSASDSEKVVNFEKRLNAIEESSPSADQQQPAANALDEFWNLDRYAANTADIPDLVRLAGPERAAVLLTRALKAGMKTLEIEGVATRQLTAKLALEHLDQLPQPVWHLVETPEDVPLYEALARKFPTVAEDFESPRRAATAVYLLALMGSGRADEAWTQFRSLADSARMSVVGQLARLAADGRTSESLTFFTRLLQEQPELSFWHLFIQLSAKQKRSAEALNLMIEVLNRPGLPPATAVEIGGEFSQALCAADQREEGILVLRELIRALRPGDVSANSTGTREAAPHPTPIAELAKPAAFVTPELLARLKELMKSAPSVSDSDYLEHCTRLAKAGWLLGHPEWTQEALALAISRSGNPQASTFDDREALRDLLALLRKYHRTAAAEKLIAGRLDFLADAEDPSESRELAEELVKLYDEAGRHTDVLLLLEKFPGWGAADLSEAPSDLLLPAAKALAAVGRVDEARRVLRRHLEDDRGDDRGYELLQKIGGEGPQIIAQLDSLASLNRFEERPLIWKARLLLDQGKLEEAEKTVRAAIAIDPSDGEQGKGDRMRAYAVLAEILENKGDADTAKVMRGAVSAIRKSEDADDWWAAGFLSEAVRRYGESLNDFADAYCIQSRLALRYSEMGDDAKAEEHYIRAFELMPDSFGRVESHCFGCEAAFASATAQNAAERVFTRLASSPPVKAQVYYLLGYLREEQNRKAEAAEAYRKAVAADPDYLNAWRKLENIGLIGILPTEEAEAVTFKLLELEPESYPSSRINSVRNFRRLWDAVPAFQRNLSKGEKGPLLPLPASAAALTAKAKNSFSLWLDSSSKETDLSREIWNDNPVIQLVIHFIESRKNR